MRATGPVVTLLALKFNLGSSICSSHPSWAWLPSDIYSICPSDKFSSLGYQSTRLFAKLQWCRWPLLLWLAFGRFTWFKMSSFWLHQLRKLRWQFLPLKAPVTSMSQLAHQGPVCMGHGQQCILFAGQVTWNFGWIKANFDWAKDSLLITHYSISHCSSLHHQFQNPPSFWTSDHTVKYETKMSDTSFQSLRAGRWIPFTFNQLTNSFFLIITFSSHLPSTFQARGPAESSQALNVVASLAVLFSALWFFGLALIELKKRRSRRARQERREEQEPPVEYTVSPRGSQWQGGPSLGACHRWTQLFRLFPNVQSFFPNKLLLLITWDVSLSRRNFFYIFIGQFPAHSPRAKEKWVSAANKEVCA